MRRWVKAAERCFAWAGPRRGRLNSDSRRRRLWLISNTTTTSVRGFRFVSRPASSTDTYAATPQQQPCTLLQYTRNETTFCLSCRVIQQWVIGVNTILLQPSSSNRPDLPLDFSFLHERAAAHTFPRMRTPRHNREAGEVITRSDRINGHGILA
jgi:hypothetical protein